MKKLLNSLIVLALLISISPIFVKTVKANSNLTTITFTAADFTGTLEYGDSVVKDAVTITFSDSGTGTGVIQDGWATGNAWIGIYVEDGYYIDSYTLNGFNENHTEGFNDNEDLMLRIFGNLPNGEIPTITLVVGKYAYFDFMNGNHIDPYDDLIDEYVIFCSESNVRLNPTTYTYDTSKYSNNPVPEGVTLTFLGWTEERYLEDKTSFDNVLVKKQHGSTYTYEDFEAGKKYYAVWANQYGTIVKFAYDDSQVILECDNIGFDKLGYQWNPEKKQLTIKNLTVIFLNRINNNGNLDNCLFTVYSSDYSNMNLVIKGKNQIGSKMSFDDMEYDSEIGNCIAGFLYSSNCITVSGNGSLTIYDYCFGLSAYDAIYITNNFTGTLTIYDKGAEIQGGQSCCLNAAGVEIDGGTIRLYNSETQAIYASDWFYYGGGDVIASSINGQAIVSSEISVDNRVEMIAKENGDGTGSDINYTVDTSTYSEYNANIINDCDATKYFTFTGVVIPPDQPIPGTNVDNTLLKAMSLMSLLVCASYLVKKKK